MTICSQIIEVSKFTKHRGFKRIQRIGMKYVGRNIKSEGTVILKMAFFSGPFPGRTRLFLKH